jgi:hypothetical protein
LKRQCWENGIAVELEECHLSYKSSNPIAVAIAITMSKDFMIHQVTAASQTHESVLKVY